MTHQHRSFTENLAPILRPVPTGAGSPNTQTPAAHETEDCYILVERSKARRTAVMHPWKTGLLASAAIFGILHPANAADILGNWSGVGEGYVSADIRQGRQNPTYFVAVVGTALQGCGGSVTVYGKLGPNPVVAESYMPDEPSAEVCRIEFEVVGRQALRMTEKSGCVLFHGASCGFSGNLLRD